MVWGGLGLGGLGCSWALLCGLGVLLEPRPFGPLFDRLLALLEAQRLFYEKVLLRHKVGGLGWLLVAPGSLFGALG